MSNSDEELDDIDMNDPPGLFEGETYNFEEETVDDISPIEKDLARDRFVKDLYSKQRSKEKNRAGALKDLDVGFKLMQLSHENLHDIITIRMQAHKTIASLVFLQRIVRGFLARRAVKQSILFRKKQEELERENAIRRICDDKHTQVERLRRDNEFLRVRCFPLDLEDNNTTNHTNNHRNNCMICGLKKIDECTCYDWKMSTQI